MSEPVDYAARAARFEREISTAQTQREVLELLAVEVNNSLGYSRSWMSVMEPDGENVRILAPEFSGGEDFWAAADLVPIEGDSKHLIFDIPCADRIVMNLPHTARQFFADALTRLNIGGTIHFYHICDREEIDSVLEQMLLEARGMGVCVDVAHKEELKTYSPSASVFSADLFLRDWC